MILDIKTLIICRFFPKKIILLFLTKYLPTNYEYESIKPMNGIFYNLYNFISFSKRGSGTVKPRFTAEFGGKETSAVNRSSR